MKPIYTLIIAATIWKTLRFLVCTSGQIAEGQYLDPNSKLLFHFDHRHEKWGNDYTNYGYEVDEKSEKLRCCVQQRVDKYLQQYYVESSSGDSTAAVVYSKADKLVIYISGIAKALRNYWAGRWVACYHVDLADDCAVLTGRCRLLAHYFEDGNIQMSTCKVLEKTDCSNLDTITMANDIGKSILDFESNLHKELNSVYSKISSTAFKDFRRILPITKQKFEWNGIHNTIIKPQ